MGEKGLSTPIPIKKTSKLDPITPGNNDSSISQASTNHKGSVRARLITANSQAKSTSHSRSSAFQQNQNQNQTSQRNNQLQQNGANPRAVNNRRFNNATPVVPKRTIENLPRTGIEYPVMKLQTQFISQHREHEPLNENKCP